MLTLLRWLVLAFALAPFAYYLLCIYAARRFFRGRAKPETHANEFAPPVSILKPVHKLDREAYENFASFCRQDYPGYELLFVVADAADPSVPVIQKLIRDFPGRPIRLLIGTEVRGSNHKVCKLCRLVREARYPLMVVSDSDVRVGADYLRAVVAPFRDGRVGAVTTLYCGEAPRSFAAEIDCVGISSSFCAGVLAAWQLEGVKFALGATMATTRERLAEIGGFEALVDRHSDDYELGRRIADRGYRVELIPEAVRLILPAQTLAEYLRHELRWVIGLRHIRPWSHLGLIFTHGLPWSLAAALVAPSAGVVAGYLVAYLVLRLLMAWKVGVLGLEDSLLRRKLWLVPLHDALAFPVWLASFASDRIEWRGLEFVLRKGRLVPIAPRAGRG